MSDWNRDTQAKKLSKAQDDRIESIIRHSQGHTLNSHLVEWFNNMGENNRAALWPHVMKMEALLIKVRDAVVTKDDINTLLAQTYKRQSFLDFRLPPDRNKDTVVIVSPGASLKLYQDRLHELSEVATICIVPTALGWVKKQGLNADFVVVADPNPSQHLLLKEAENDAPVIAATISHPGIAIENDVYWYSLLLGNGEDDPKDNELFWWDVPVRDLENDIAFLIPSLGCSTNTAVKLVQEMRSSGWSNAKRIVLLGCDYSSWDGYERVPGLDHVFEWPEIDFSKGWFRWEGRWTDARMVIYKLVLLRLWAQLHAPIYTMSHGILHEFPRVEFDNVMSGEYSDNLSWREIYERIDTFEAYMAKNFPRSKK